MCVCVCVGKFLSFAQVLSVIKKINNNRNEASNNVAYMQLCYTYDKLIYWEECTIKRGMLNVLLRYVL